MRKTQWNTYATYGYTHDVANDVPSQGGVHLHQIRKTQTGWQKRICQSNGKHKAYSPVTLIDEAAGEARYAAAAQQ